jgi:phage terminase large subunit-like protein
MTNSPPSFRPTYYPSLRRLEWPNGVVGRLYSGDEPKQFLGSNLGWLGLDELARWPNLAEAVPMFELALRHGERPRGVVATTPLPDLDYLRFLYRFGENDAPELGEDGMPIPLDNVRIVHGSTYDNAANLAPDFLLTTVRRFEGTALGDQELRGLVQLESRDAIWRRAWIRRCEVIPELVRTGIFIDPAVSSGPQSAETGILVVGQARDGDLFALEDASGHYTEGEWSDLAVALCELYEADVIAAEENNGGTLVKAAIIRAIERAKAMRTPAGDKMARAAKRAKVTLVRATQDKAERASLVVGLWEHGHVHHVGHPHGWVKLEHQLCTFDPNRPHKKQPADRMDAIVWAVLVLAGDGTDRKPVAALSLAQGWAKIAEQLRRRGAR